MNKFYCKAGDIETTIPWHRPKLETVKEWFKEFSTSSGLEHYEIYLVGNFAEITFGGAPLTTWDVDVVLVADNIRDNSELKAIMDNAIKLGFENKLLIDIYYNDALLDFNNFKKLIQVRNYNRFYKERGSEVFDYHVKGDKVKALQGGLYQITHDKPSKSIIKAYDRVQAGEYRGLQINARKVL
jgi:hypothetical protein